MSVAISREVAEAEVTAWLDFKKIFKSQREKDKDNIEILIEAICEGILVLDPETNCFTLNLMVPVGVDIITTSLTFLARMNDKILKPYMIGLRAGDSIGYLNNYAAALTGAPKPLIESLDSSDKKIVMAITSFFI